MNIQNMLTIFGTAVLPALWVAVGPNLTAAITAWINNIVGAYVPRPVQLIMSSLLTSIAAGLSGPMAGIDGTTAAGIGLATGLGTQAFAMIHPKTLLTSAPEPVIPLPPAAPTVTVPPPPEMPVSTAPPVPAA